jgi:hypothetical protein
MSRAAIFSFLPILTKVLPESVTKMEKGRYYRNRFHEISEKWIREHRQEYRGNRTGDLQVGSKNQPWGSGFTFFLCEYRSPTAYLFFARTSQK